ncbi:MAG: L-rhamnose mutarotase [Candidatus Latescibacteria bacterium]|nr:L-rhamnose mutarotase [Candidatus Latescibacterota bacterium]
MIRRAFTMKLKPGAMAEYKRHHDEIWAELVAEVRRSGIATITTFEADPVLFLFSEITDEGAWNRLWTSDVHRRWGEVMEPLMHFKDGVVDAGELREIFRLDTGLGKKGGKKKGARKAAKAAKKVAKAVKKAVKEAARKLPAKPAKKAPAKKKAAAPKAPAKKPAKKAGKGK